MIIRPYIQRIFGNKEDTEPWNYLTCWKDYLVDQEDGLKRLLTWFLNLVMQLEAVQQSGADPYERNESRTAQRNGYKERSLKTRVGDIVLKKPQFRNKLFKSCVFDKYSRVEIALTNAIAESYLQGVSPRRFLSSLGFVTTAIARSSEQRLRTTRSKVLVRIL
jgi:hypothetical protein